MNEAINNELIILISIDLQGSDSLIEAIPEAEWLDLNWLASNPNTLLDDELPKSEAELHLNPGSPFQVICHNVPHMKASLKKIVNIFMKKTKL